MAMARDVEEKLRPDNDAFAQRVWGKSWADVFAVDVSEEFTPNDSRSAGPTGSRHDGCGGRFAQ